MARVPCELRYAGISFAPPWTARQMSGVSVSAQNGFFPDDHGWFLRTQFYNHDSAESFRLLTGDGYQYGYDSECR
jgi:hypothetical protein